MKIRHKCLVGAFFGVVLGVAFNAYAQDVVAIPTAAAAPELYWIELLKGGGLPAVLGGGFFWLVRRVADGIPMKVSVDDRVERHIEDLKAELRDLKQKIIDRDK